MSDEALTLAVLVSPSHRMSWVNSIQAPKPVKILVVNLTNQVIGHANDSISFLTPPEDTVFYDLRTNSITDFSGIRNWVLSKVKTKWVLFLDADETLEDTDWNQILTVIKSDTFTGYKLYRKDIFAGKTLSYGETGHANFLRLFQTKKGRWTGGVHEKAIIDGKCQILNITITHHSHSDISQFIAQVSCFAQLEACHRRSSYRQNLIQLCIFPWAKLWVNVVIKSAWRDGWQGMVYAYVMSLHSLCVRIYQWQNHEN